MHRRADVAELADAHGSGPCSRKGVEVQVLSSAPEPSGIPQLIEKTQAVGTCGPQKQKSSLSRLLHQAILMMQAGKHRRLHDVVTRQLVSVVASRNTILVGFGIPGPNEE